MVNFIKIHPDDNVGVAIRPIAKGETVDAGGVQVTALEEIKAGHKMALAPIKKGENVIKYGHAIGSAQADIAAGEWVHVQNLRTNLNDKLEYTYSPALRNISPEKPQTFQGYVRPDGKVGVRNELWIIPTVGCVNGIAQIIAREAQELVKGSIDGLYAFAHPYGCSQLSEDHKMTQKALAGLVNHPNAGGVLVLGLGCENNNIGEFQKVLGETDPRRVKFLNCQDADDEVAAAVGLLRELAEYAGGFQREACPADKLVIGLKCGGSDGLSGISANPLVGAFSDILVAQGGTSILTEVPEMFGAETILMNRCKDEATFEKTVALINNFKDYFIRYGQEIYENPSPGNKAGGISTLEDKSLGCTQKGGSATVMDVLAYGDPVKAHGLNLLQAPGNDLVASTALAVSGAQIVLFTTGRGTPFGCPVPTVKISSNTPLYERKRGWIDFNAGAFVDGTPMEELSRTFYDYILSVASGEHTTGENHGVRDLAIFKDGVTL
ncbi:MULTISPECIES: UxaA family hydrolase [Anaerotruncus]|jgi:altronate hydrolase|uniref:UxaA family hydrolase n=1 Tax=Anaerotruncus TaxID=244127 RepID=UPI00082B1C34|nr:MULTISPECIES: altronate dehydratase family protein [Anaerotruncus]RGX55641.1 altronate dehydratase [Anaerotruncus sp. AF02-27]